jgi:hypothetical protein
VTEGEPCEGPNTRHEPAESDHGEPREGLSDALHRVQPVAQRDAEDGDGPTSAASARRWLSTRRSNATQQLWLQ